MKTLTELSGSVIRLAAAAIAEARRSLPSEEKPAAPAASDPPAGAAGEATGDAPAAGDPAPEPTEARAAGSQESDAAKAALDAAVASATGLSGDRLTMLRGAVQLVGTRAGDVRLVRVFGPEEQMPSATRLGEYQYLVDFFPLSMKQVAAPAKERHGSRGRGGGGGGSRGSGGRGVQGGGTGGFSMDSLRDDRKNERGGGRGRPGGGRKPGGGGTAGGGGSGGAPGGTPKK